MGVRINQLKKMMVAIGLMFFVSACVKHEPETRCEPPSWFLESTRNDGIKTGVGEGASPEEASTAAMSEIGSQISAWVNSRTEILAERNSSVSESRFHHQVELESKHRLKNAKRLNMAFCGNRYYVKYAVDLRPQAVVMADALLAEYKGETIQLTGSPALTGSSFAQDVKQSMGFRNEEVSKGVVRTIPLHLTFADGIWWVNAGLISLPVSDVSEVVNLNVYATQDVQLDICDRSGTSRPTHVKTGDEVFFSVPGGVGFFTIFNIYADGRVSVIAANQPGKKDRVIFPDPSGKCVLSASTLTPGNPSVDIYLLLLSPTIQDISAFAALHDDGRTVAGDESFSTHVLAKFLDSIGKKQVAILKTRTEP